MNVMLIIKSNYLHLPNQKKVLKICLITANGILRMKITITIAKNEIKKVIPAPMDKPIPFIILLIIVVVFI